MAAATVFGALVLAAGDSQRMGGRPKPLIERDGVPLVRRVVQALLGAGVGEIVVVVGHRADEVAWVVTDLPVRVVVNESYSAGQATSFRKGLIDLPESVGATLVALADQPLLEPVDVTAILEQWAKRGAARAIVPRVQERRGHPVVLEASVCSEILRGDAGYGAREWMDEHPDEVAWFDCENVHYVEDVDYPEDLDRIAQRHGCAMRWPV